MLHPRPKRSFPFPLLLFLRPNLRAGYQPLCSPCGAWGGGLGLLVVGGSQRLLKRRKLSRPRLISSQAPSLFPESRSGSPITIDCAEIDNRQCYLESNLYSFGGLCDGRPGGHTYVALNLSLTELKEEKVCATKLSCLACPLFRHFSHLGPPPLSKLHSVPHGPTFPHMRT